MARKNNKIIGVIDTETDPFIYNKIPEPFAAGIYSECPVTGEIYYKCFYEQDPEILKQKVVKEISDKHWRLYAHNGGRFDFFFFMEYLEDIVVIDGRIAKARIGKCILVDSFLLLPFPLAAYKKTEIDYSIFQRSKRYIKSNRKKIESYLYDDCRYLYEWLDEWRSRFGITLTLASASHKQLKETGYEITRTKNKFWDAKFRKFYYGGRCQCFESGHIKGNYNLYDINSAYPYAMLFPHPHGYDMKYSETIPESGVYFAEITARSFGALPCREDNKIIFPDETGRYFATSWEIEAGLETGTLNIIKVHRVYIPQRVETFENFVNTFYQEKLDAKNCGDKTREQFAKFILNSSYGKFALNPQRFKAYEITESGKTPEGEGWQIIYDNDDYSIFQKPDPKDTYYNVLTAASITGFVRAFLLRAICASENVLYCDTDSIVCKKFGGKLGDDLGQWKHEASISEAWIAGKKLYTFLTPQGFKSASKGARLSPLDIQKIVSGEIINWKNEAPSFSLRYGARFINRDIQLTA